MRTYTAVEVDLGDRGKGWHYASLGSRGGGPIGYCTEHPPHPTEAEARACYRRYERSRIRIGGVLSGWTGCNAKDPTGAVCDAPTKTSCDYDGFHVAGLCEQHNTIDHATVALGLDGDQAGDSYRS